MCLSVSVSVSVPVSVSVSVSVSAYASMSGDCGVVCAFVVTVCAFVGAASALGPAVRVVEESVHGCPHCSTAGKRSIDIAVSFSIEMVRWVRASFLAFESHE